jgi:hypothetical protein
MLEQMLEGFRKASESSMQMQQEMWKSWGQQWTAGAPGATPSAEWARAFQKRYLDLTLDVLNKHREAIDSAYRAGIQMVEQSLRASEAGSVDDYRRMVEELWHKLFETFRSQYDTQFQDVKRWAEATFQMTQDSKAQA